VLRQAGQDGANDRHVTQHARACAASLATTCVGATVDDGALRRVLVVNFTFVSSVTNKTVVTQQTFSSILVQTILHFVSAKPPVGDRFVLGSLALARCCSFGSSLCLATPVRRQFVAKARRARVAKEFVGRRKEGKRLGGAVKDGDGGLAQ